jgi:hypothetical protein
VVGAGLVVVAAAALFGFGFAFALFDSESLEHATRTTPATRRAMRGAGGTRGRIDALSVSSRAVERSCRE